VQSASAVSRLGEVGQMLVEERAMERWSGWTEAEQQIADAGEKKLQEEEEEAEWSLVENFEAAEVVEFRLQSKVSDEAEVHVGTAVSF